MASQMTSRQTRFQNMQTRHIKLQFGDGSQLWAMGRTYKGKDPAKRPTVSEDWVIHPEDCSHCLLTSMNTNADNKQTNIQGVATAKGC